VTQDISLEPLFNQGAVGTGSDKKPGLVLVDAVGVALHRTPITVTSTAQKITITTGKRTIEMQNTSSNIVYFGGVGVTSAKGIKFFPNSSKVFANVKDSFSIYLITSGAETAEVRIVEYS